jgi:hypothetical protein
MLALILAVGSIPLTSGHGLSDMIPERARGGRLFSEALERESAGSTFRNTTANIFAQQTGVHSLPVSLYASIVFFLCPTDHFNPHLGTFDQRYWIDTTFWSGKGPCFLYINGEAPASGSPTGFAQVLGSTMNAFLVTLEHRWFVTFSFSISPLSKLWHGLSRGYSLALIS